jgi:hypothetical protein
MLGGCAAGLVPLPIQILGAAKTVYDAGAIIADEKTINDHVISEIVDKECKTRSLLEGEEYCKVNLDKAIKDYIENLKTQEQLKQKKENKDGKG